MRRYYLSTLLCLACAMVVAGTSGCRNQTVFTPKGPMNQQQANAIIHDPFPQNDIGPYEAASRPPSYQQPLPEAERNRIVPDAMWWLGR